MNVKLVVADAHPLILEGLDHLCGQDDGFDIIARCSTGPEMLAAAYRLQPDIVILDPHMPTGKGSDGLDLIRILQETDPSPRVIVLTENLSEREALECIRLRVSGIVLKDMPSHLVMQCIRKVAAGDVWVEKDSFSRVLDMLLRREEGMQSLAVKLSDRETQVMTLCTQGLTNGEIAQRLFVSEGTVKTHLHHVYRKLEVDGRAELVRFAHQNGLV